MRAALPIALAATILLGAAPRQDPLTAALDGRVAGAPVDCVSVSRLDGPQIIDEHTIIYRESGRRVWRNDLAAACPGLRPMDTMVVDVWGSQLCRNDHFRSFSAGSTIPGAICRFGQFVPYDKVKK